MCIAQHPESSCCLTLSVLLKASRARLLVRSAGEYRLPQNNIIVNSYSCCEKYVSRFNCFTLCGLWLSLFKVIRSDKCSVIIKTFKWHANSRHNNPLKSWWNRSITFRWFYHGVKRACVCVNNSCTEHSVLELTLSWHESENWKRGAPVRGNY